MNDPAQHAAIINTRLAAHIGRQQGRDPLPLRIGKPEEISHVTASLAEAVNHNPIKSGIWRFL
jgi:hypothetical protein